MDYKFDIIAAGGQTGDSTLFGTNATQTYMPLPIVVLYKNSIYQWGKFLHLNDMITQCSISTDG